MKIKRQRFIVWSILLPAVVALFFTTAHAGEDLNVLKIDPDEQSAVVKTADDHLKVIQQGDELEPYGRILSISAERIVFMNKKAEKTILVLANGKQTTRRIGKINASASKRRLVAISASSDKENGAVHEFSADKAKRNEKKK